MTARSKAADTVSNKTSEEIQTFYPPKSWPLLIRLVQGISYPLAQWLYKCQISVNEDGLGRVKAIDDSRIVYVCNHPTMEDGITLFVLSARLGQLFHYVVAYEAFKGLMGWLIQHLGCYSIRRGLGDRTSISQTLTLLKQPQCRLVIFPEGGCSYQNDTIMPFRSGAIQLPMSVLAQLAKKAASPADIPDFYIVPISLKYRYQQPMQRVISDTLERLEDQLGITSTAPDADNYQRLRQVAHQVILNIEAEAQLPPEEGMNWNERIERLRQVFVRKCEAKLNIEPAENLALRERVYKVQALLEDAEQADTPITHEEQIDREAVFWDTVRLLNFDAIYDGYVAESPTAERFLDTLIRLEREVFHLKDAPHKAPRKACFYVGDPINLKDYLADYKGDRTGTVNRLSEQLRTTMQQSLNQMSTANQ
ncbi:MAG: lysophospholipid acyltransferase family protein [Phormidesmis sp.]